MLAPTILTGFEESQYISGGYGAGRPADVIADGPTPTQKLRMNKNGRRAYASGTSRPSLSEPSSERRFCARFPAPPAATIFIRHPPTPDPATRAARFRSVSAVPCASLSVSVRLCTVCLCASLCIFSAHLLMSSTRLSSSLCVYLRLLHVSVRLCASPVRLYSSLRVSCASLFVSVRLLSVTRPGGGASFPSLPAVVRPRRRDSRAGTGYEVAAGMCGRCNLNGPPAGSDRA